MVIALVSEFYMSLRFFLVDSLIATKCWNPLSDIPFTSFIIYGLLSELMRATAKPFGATKVGVMVDVIALIYYLFFFFYFLLEALFELESYLKSMIISRSLLTTLVKPCYVWCESL